MAKTYAQTVDEIRSLSAWLLAEGCPTVALCGLSMSAWLAGMTVCRDARFTAVVMTAPAVHSNPAYASRIIWRSVREACQGVRAADEALDETPFNLTRARPAIPRENILLVDGIQDLVTPAEPIEQLWQLWGHISLSLCLTGLISPVLRWLAPSWKPVEKTTHDRAFGKIH